MNFCLKPSAIDLVMTASVLLAVLSSSSSLAASHEFATVNEILVPGQSSVYEVNFNDVNDGDDGSSQDEDSNDGKKSSVRLNG